MSTATQPDVTAAMKATPIHRVHGSFEEVSHLRSAWNRLACRTGDLFGSYDWCETWWRHFGARRRLEIHTLHDKDQLVAVMPLFRELLMIGCVCLHVVRMVACDYGSDAVGLAMEPQYAEEFLHTVLARLGERGPWDVLQIGPLRSYHGIVDTLGCACVCSPHVGKAIIGRQDNWLTMYDLPPRYEDYLQTMPRHDRHDTQRRERRLREGREVEISQADTPERVEEAMNALVNLHQQLWTAKGEHGHFGDWPALARFHHEIAQKMLRSGQLALVTIKVDKQVVGAAYGCHFGGRTHSMFRGYRSDSPWRNFALGRMLHFRMIRSAIERGSSVVESGRGVFDYKLRLGGALHGERSLAIVHSGWHSRLRVWAAMRAAYLLHAGYGRIWMDMLAPRLGLRPRPWHSYVRFRFLAHLVRRIPHLSLFTGPVLVEARGVAPPPHEAEPLPQAETTPPAAIAEIKPRATDGSPVAPIQAAGASPAEAPHASTRGT